MTSVLGDLPGYIARHRIELTLVLFVVLAAETSALALARRAPYGGRLVLTTSFMWLVLEGLRAAALPLRIFVFVAASAFAPGSLRTSWPVAVACYALVDLVYYAKHRLLHRTGWGWALHEVHHSSSELNLLAALRLGWVQRSVDDYFYLPLVLLGFDPLLTLGIVELNHASQLWCHTPLVGRLGVLDRILNTPSNHRVHHARDRETSDHNYGSTFMLWDRLFGTYRAERSDTAPEYGVDGGYRGFDPIRIQLGPIARYVRHRTAERRPPAMASAPAESSAAGQQSRAIGSESTATAP